MPNKTILSALPVDEMSDQSTSTVELRVLAPNKTMLSVPPIYEAPNKPTPTI